MAEQEILNTETKRYAVSIWFEVNATDERDAFGIAHQAAADESRRHGTYHDGECGVVENGIELVRV